MRQIDFSLSGWTTEAADDVLKVIAIEEGTKKLYTILVGGMQVASRLPQEDPRVQLAQKIAAGLPAHLASLAEQAFQYEKPLAYRLHRPIPE